MKEPEISWIVHKQINGVPHYWVGGKHCWSPKHEDAIRFARAIDGDRVLASIGIQESPTQNAPRKEHSMKTLRWILRHPFYAASWYLRGKPYSEQA